MPELPATPSTDARRTCRWTAGGALVVIGVALMSAWGVPIAETIRLALATVALGVLPGWVLTAPFRRLVAGADRAVCAAVLGLVTTSLVHYLWNTHLAGRPSWPGTDAALFGWCAVCACAALTITWRDRRAAPEATTRDPRWTLALVGVALAAVPALLPFADPNGQLDATGISFDMDEFTHFYLVGSMLRPGAPSVSTLAGFPMPPYQFGVPSLTAAYLRLVDVDPVHLQCRWLALLTLALDAASAAVLARRMLAAARAAVGAALALFYAGDAATTWGLVGQTHSAMAYAEPGGSGVPGDRRPGGALHSVTEPHAGARPHAEHRGARRRRLALRVALPDQGTALLHRRSGARLARAGAPTIAPRPPAPGRDRRDGRRDRGARERPMELGPLLAPSGSPRAPTSPQPSRCSRRRGAGWVAGAGWRSSRVCPWWHWGSGTCAGWGSPQRGARGGASARSAPAGACSPRRVRRGWWRRTSCTSRTTRKGCAPIWFAQHPVLLVSQLVAGLGFAAMLESRARATAWAMGALMLTAVVTASLGVGDEPQRFERAERDCGEWLREHRARRARAPRPGAHRAPDLLASRASVLALEPILRGDKPKRIAPPDYMAALTRAVDERRAAVGRFVAATRASEANAIADELGASYLFLGGDDPLGVDPVEAFGTPLTTCGGEGRIFAVGGHAATTTLRPRRALITGQPEPLAAPRATARAPRRPGTRGAPRAAAGPARKPGPYG